MVEKMASGESKSSGKPPLASDIDLPVFDEPMREHWPSKMTWSDAIEHLAPSRKRYMREFDSPEQRLRAKNPESFRLP